MSSHNILKSHFNRIIKRICAAINVLIGRHCSYDRYRHKHHSLTYSQEGEDCLLHRIYVNQMTGFYVDIGAHHPQLFSNTYRFYLRGWQGINIDPLPGSKLLFDKFRPNDLNLEVAISDSNDCLIYHSFEEPAFNTFDTLVAGTRHASLLSQQYIRTYKLADILDKYLPAGQHIDFMTIDVEGLDLNVLRSNDWSRFRPTYVLAESLGMQTIYQVIDSPLHTYMRSNNYSLFAKCVNTLFFIDNLS